MEKQDNLKLFAIIVGFIISIGFPIYTIINSKYLDKNGVKTKGILLKKNKFLGGKPLTHHYYFTVKYRANNKLKIKEIGVSKKAYYAYKIDDTISVLVDKVNSKNIKWTVKQD